MVKGFKVGDLIFHKDSLTFVEVVEISDELVTVISKYDPLNQTMLLSGVRNTFSTKHIFLTAEEGIEMCKAYIDRITENTTRLEKEIIKREIDHD